MHHRPLLICDADGVLVHFIDAFEAYLNAGGYSISLTHFSLAGAITRNDTHAAASQNEMNTLIDDFFAQHVEQCPPVPGAAEALHALSHAVDILILTNIPEAQGARRAAALAQYGMPYPVLTNVGPKGPAVKALIGDRPGPVAFIDDLPPHHQSVAHTVPSVHRIHCVAEPRLQHLAPTAAYAHTRIDDWAQTLPYLERVFHLTQAV